MTEPHRHDFWADRTTGVLRWKCSRCGKISQNPTVEEVLEQIQDTRPEARNCSESPNNNLS